MIEFGYSLVFQILNTALVLLIFIGLPVYLIKNHKKGKQIEIKLKLIDDKLKAIEEKIDRKAILDK